MGLLEDVLNVLDRVPIWKRLKQVPAEVDEIKERIIALEDRLGSKWPADVCRFCGERAARLSSSRAANDKGIVTEYWHCEKCQESDLRSYKAK
jgi:hypothetical protein